jgi:hypothetical protein
LQDHLFWFRDIRIKQHKKIRISDSIVHGTGLSLALNKLSSSKITE